MEDEWPYERSQSQPSQVRCISRLSCRRAAPQGAVSAAAAGTGPSSISWRFVFVLGSCAAALTLGVVLRPAQGRHVPNALAFGSRELVSQVELEENERRAYVMMAYDPPGAPVGDCLWGALAIARALQRLSKYPLILLSNTTALSDGVDLTQTLVRLNVKLIPVQEIKIPGKPGWTFQRWKFAFWKLQVWTLTDYDKLIWLDSDAIAYRDLDWIFDKPGMWSQRDDWFCKGEQHGVCSGIMSLKPSMDIYNGLLQYAEQVVSTLVRGDQQLISQYFAQVVGKPIQLLDDADAAFGQCLGSASGNGFGDIPSGSWWDMRAFVHKSGGFGNTNDNDYNNVCFSSNMTRQRYVVGGKVINVCHFHPLGAYWRGLFCEAASVVGSRQEEVMSFCSDSCYYTGQALDGTPCEHTQAWELREPLAAVLPRYPPNMLFHLAPLGEPAPDHMLHTSPMYPVRGYVNFQDLDMSEWNCKGGCPKGGCCSKEDCQQQCRFNAAQVGGFCQEVRWAADSMQCQLFGNVKATYSSQGGHSGVVFSESLAYPGAELPKAPFTVMAKIRTASQGDCQDIIAWGDGAGTWKSVEFRVTLGNLLYGEALDEEWTQVMTEASNLADGSWHDIAVVRPATGEVILYVDGTEAARGFVGKGFPDGLLPMARSARMSHTQGCIFDGDVGRLDIYDFDVGAELLRKLAAAAG